MIKHEGHWMPKEEIPALTFGRVFHSAAAALAKGERALPHLVELPAEEQDVAKTLVALYGEWLEKKRLRFYHVERPHIYRTFEDYELIIKPDGVVETDDGIFLLELKTTGGWGASMASHMYASLQMQTYLYLGQKFYPDLRGMLVLVFTKRNTRLVEEPIALTQDVLRRGEDFWYYTFEYYNEMAHFWPKNPTACSPLTGRECLYYPICWYNLPPQEICEQRDPDEHLELDRVEPVILEGAEA